MPIYEYECESCDERFELMQKFSDKPVKKCPACGGAVHKVLSPPALLFKGTGWYVTDYANRDRKKAQKADGDGKSNGAKTSETTTTASSTQKADGDGKSNGAKTSETTTTASSTASATADKTTA